VVNDYGTSLEEFSRNVASANTGVFAWQTVQHITEQIQTPSI